MNMVRNLAQAKAPQRLAPSQGMLAFSPAEIRPFLHHKSAGPHHRRGILRLSGRQRRNGAEVGSGSKPEDSDKPTAGGPNPQPKPALADNKATVKDFEKFPKEKLEKIEKIE